MIWSCIGLAFGLLLVTAAVRDDQGWKLGFGDRHHVWRGWTAFLGVLIGGSSLPEIVSVVTAFLARRNG